MALRGYYLGCPGWGVKTWVGRLFPEGTKPTEYLACYARAFNSVEGNTTFYALPTADTVARWDEQTPAEFRFCFKFPREVTHDKLLIDAADEVATFLARVAPLGDKLGTLMLQLPARFGPPLVPRLRAFLEALPRDHHYAVELRDPVFFHDRAARRAVLDLLAARGVDLVVMDARGVHSSKSLMFAEVRARKPNLPVFAHVTADRPIVRCVPHEDFAASAHLVAEWAPRVAAWIAEGKRPYVFLHAPDDTFASDNAYAFHAMLRAHADVGDLPAAPGAARQLGLF